jgi:hypothetical protein
VVWKYLTLLLLALLKDQFTYSLLARRFFRPVSLPWENWRAARHQPLDAGFIPDIPGFVCERKNPTTI